MEVTYRNRWNIDFYGNSAFLLGANLNSNDSYGEREFYLSLYIGKWTLSVGKFFS